MEFGKLISCERTGNRVNLHFEKADGRLEVVTDKILNVFSGAVSREHRSKAIEGEKAVDAPFTVEDETGEGGRCVAVSTDSVTAKIYDGFKVDFYAADGRVLCRD